ncbi:hypothetical protein [Metabacillus fastidiosus]
MKMTTAYALAWLSTGIAVSVGIFVTGSAVPIWGMLIPACVSFKSDDK